MRFLGLLVTFFGLIGSQAWGQQQPYLKFEHIEGDQVSYNVKDLVVDRYGLLWIATNAGLVRYDGYRFTHIRRQPGESNSLLHDDVNVLLEDRNGLLWIGTDGAGLSSYDPASGTFTHYQLNPEQPSQSLSSALVSVLLQDQAGILWVGTHGGGLNRLDPATGTVRQYRPGASEATLGHASIHALIETASGELWIGTEGGLLHRFDPRSETFTRYQIGTEATSVRAILGEGSSLWVGVNGEDATAGLYRFDLQSESARRFVSDAASDLQSITTLAYDDEERLWIGTAQSGLFTLDGDRKTLAHYVSDLEDPHSLRNQHIRVLYPTPDGILWVGSELGGLNKLNLRQMALGRYKLNTARFSVREEEMGVYAIYESRDGTRWLGTTNGLLRIDPTTEAVTRYSTDEGPPHARLIDNTVSAIYEDQDQMLWLGTDAGLVQFDPKAESATAFRRSRQSSDQKNDDAIFDIQPGESGRLWLATNGGGLLRFDPATESFKAYTFEEGSDNRRNYVLSIVSGKDGLWLGSIGGLLRFDPVTEAWQSYGNTHADLREIILSIFRDPAGVLWLGTHDGGLLRFDPQQESLRRYTRSDGLPGNTITAIERDDQGGLWISAAQDGLAYFDAQAESVLQFGPLDGALAYFNQNAVFKTRKSLLLAGVGGYNEISLKAPPRVSAPTIILETQGGQQFETGSHLRLTSSGEGLPLRMVVLDFVDPARNRCFYRLQEVHTSWVACTRGLETFTSLGTFAGEYTLEVMGLNGHGVETDAVFNVFVPGPWWGRRWVQLVGLLIVFGLGWAGVYVVHRRKLSYQYKHEVALQEVRQKEREQLASWVHNAPLADLVGLRFNLENLHEEPLSSLGEKRVQSIKDTLAEVRSALRNICGELQLPSFTYGLGMAIRSHIIRYERMYPEIAVTLDLMEDGQLFPEYSCQLLFSIYRMAMNNVVKHAEASHVVVRLYKHDNNSIRLEIEDNGRGFDPPKHLMDLRENQQYGLLLAERQAHTIRGQLEIHSQPGLGTCIQVEIKS